MNVILGMKMIGFSFREKTIKSNMGVEKCRQQTYNCESGGGENIQFRPITSLNEHLAA